MPQTQTETAGHMATTGEEPTADDVHAMAEHGGARAQTLQARSKAGASSRSGPKGSAGKAHKMDDKIQKLLGDGWRKVAKVSGGHYEYVAPNGQRFSSVATAQQYANESEKGVIGKKKEAKGAGSAGGSGKKGKGKAGEEVKGEQLPAAPLQRAKTARPFEKAYLREVDAIWHHKKFDKVCEAVASKGLLEKQQYGEMAPGEFVARLVAAVQQAMDIHLGRDAVEATKRRMVKIPHHLFRDYRASGALGIIVEETLQYMKDEGIRDGDVLLQRLLSQESAVECEHLQLLQQVRQALVDAKLLVAPVIFFSPSILRGKSGRERMEECRRWAQALRAQVVEEQVWTRRFVFLVCVSRLDKSRLARDAREEATHTY